jgi:hypothetical protein
MTSRHVIRAVLPWVDWILTPLTYLAALLMRTVRSVGVQRLPQCRRVLLEVGVFPIRNHYYEPRFDYRHSSLNSDHERNLPGIDWNLEAQRALLRRMVFASELASFDGETSNADSFDYSNSMFKSGDAEYWYQMIRLFKPRRLIEIGGGYSTLMARRAVVRNASEDAEYHCSHCCVEPFEALWLDQLGVSVVRRRVEELGVSFFSKLSVNDILFIDSSHVIRPGGDVLFECLELLPSLRPGVIVHFHDVFSPRSYPYSWLADEVRLWNEQFLLEAFLSHNNCWQVIGALNYLHHSCFEDLRSVAPHLTPDREPGSFYIRRMA